jgi:hypothetical protein
MTDHSQLIRKILLPLKQQVLDKINQNMSIDKKNLNIMKATVPEIFLYGTFERTFSTCLGHKLQEIASVCGKKVTNIDKTEGKVLGIDLRIDFDKVYEGQMKANTNTQTGTHKKDSFKKLIDITTKNETQPFFVTALGESYEYYKDGILFIGGKCFWEKIGVDYNTVYNTIVEIIKETYEEVKRIDFPTV